MPTSWIRNRMYKSKLAPEWQISLWGVTFVNFFELIKVENFITMSSQGFFLTLSGFFRRAGWNMKIREWEQRTEIEIEINRFKSEIWFNFEVNKIYVVTQIFYWHSSQKKSDCSSWTQTQILTLHQGFPLLVAHRKLFPDVNERGDICSFWKGSLVMDRACVSAI